jgi:hypothetical protein
MKKKLPGMIAEQLLQRHHILYKQLFEHVKFGPWLKKLGVQRDSWRNCMYMPTILGKLRGIGGKRSVHWGDHIDTYFKKVDGLIDDIYKRHAAKTITDEQAKLEISGVQAALRYQLKTGEIKLQHEGQLFGKYAATTAGALLVASLTPREQEMIQQRITARFMKNFELRLDNHVAQVFRASKWSGNGWDACGWTGTFIDLFNPGDDVATLFDVVELSVSLYNWDETMEWTQSSSGFSFSDIIEE